jgi:hypothetical protein
MASITPTVEPDYLPPRVMLRVDATPGCLLRSCLMRRVQHGMLSSIRRQPPVGVDSALCYDYESWYGVPCSYEATGLEQVQPLTAMWHDAVNASMSRLLDGAGNVIATNLIESPKPLSTGYYTNNTTVALSDTADGMRISAVGSSEGNPFVTVNAGGTLPAGSYHLHAELPDHSGDQWADMLIGIWNYIMPYPDALVDGVVDFEATFSNDVTMSAFQIKCPVGGYAVWRRLGLYTAADWQAMQEAGVTWFDGDYTREASTQSYDVSSSPLTLSPDSGWLIHPGNPAKSMRLPMGYVTGIGNTTRRTNATRHDRLGATYPVYTIPGPRYSREYTLNLRTRGPDDEQMLLALTDDQTPLLIDWLHDDAQRLNMDPMYIQVGDISSDRYAQMLYPADASTPLWWRDWQLPCIEVDSPAVSQQAVGWTYAQLLFEQPTYQSVMDEYATYADLTAHNKKDS